MLIKSADDKAKDIEILQGLLNHPAATADTKKRIEQEIRFMLSGIKGEKAAAYEIDFHYGPLKNWAVIHDLRIEHGGRVAQIDHILVNKFLDVWVCESKRLKRIDINEHGECTAFYGGKPYGIPSPFEQNRKHCALLKAACDDGAVALPRRLGFAIKPDIKSMVLVSKKTLINRPKVDGLYEILKVDQFKTRIDKTSDSDNKILRKVKTINPDTLKDFASRLAALHSTISFDWHGKFGLPKGTIAHFTPVNKPQEVDAAPVAAKKPTAVREAPAAQPADGEKKSKLACSGCGTVVAYNVAKFCWFNKAKFGGNVYCMDCQKTLPAAD